MGPATPAPTSPPKDTGGDDWSAYMTVGGKICRSRTLVGKSAKNPKQCAEAAQASPSCGDIIAFSEHIVSILGNGGCRCCTKGKGLYYEYYENWNMYEFPSTLAPSPAPAPATPAPTSPPKDTGGDDWSAYMTVGGKICRSRALVGRSAKTPKQCAEAAQASPSCGDIIAFSQKIANQGKGGCRCCLKDKGDGNNEDNENWNMYEIPSTNGGATTKSSKWSKSAKWSKWSKSAKSAKSANTGSGSSVTKDLPRDVMSSFSCQQQIDYPGHDKVRLTGVASLEDCARHCKDESCNLFVFNFAGVCWIKDGTTPRSSTWWFGKLMGQRRTSCTAN